MAKESELEFTPGEWQKVLCNRNKFYQGKTTGSLYTGQLDCSSNQFDSASSETFLLKRLSYVFSLLEDV